MPSATVALSGSGTLAAARITPTATRAIGFTGTGTLTATVLAATFTRAIAFTGAGTPAAALITPTATAAVGFDSTGTPEVARLADLARTADASGSGELGVRIDDVYVARPGPLPKVRQWRFEAGPSTNAPVGQLTTARNAKLTFKLTEPSSLTFDVNGRHSEALDLIELATDVHATREGEVLFTGRLGSTQDTLDDKTHVTSCTVVDTRGLLARRYTSSARTYSNTNAGTFVRDMLNDAQAQVGASPHASSLGITVPVFTGAATLTRTSKAGSVILSELTDAQSTGVDDGSALFDWDITPGWSARTARYWPGGRGRDLTGGTSAVILDATFLTDANGRPRPRTSIVASITRKLDPATYANVYRVSGGSFSTVVPASQADFAVRTADGTAYVSSTSDGGTVKDYTDDTATITVTTTPVTLTDGTKVWDMGVWAQVEDKASDLVTQSALNAFAAKRIAELSRVAPSYSVRLVANRWGGPSHVWLGDKVRLIIRSGRLFEDVALRVREVAVGIGDNGEETVDLVVGPVAQPSPLTVLRDQQRELNQLLKTAARGA